MSDAPRALVEEFFERMADEAARPTIGELFADDAVITLPGERFEGPNAADAMLEWLAPRYVRASKVFEEWIEAGEVVVSRGTLFGVDADGERFDGVRYVDVYRVDGGEIARLDIYNDLAAEGIVE